MRLAARSIFFSHLKACFLGAFLLADVSARAQAPAPLPTSPAQTPAPPDTAAPDLPKGEILIQSHGEPQSSTPQPEFNGPQTPPRVPDENAKVAVSDAERGALAFTSYDLDARLDLPLAGLTVRARVELRNISSTSLAQIPLQISSTLHWESATLVEGDRRTRLVLAQHQLDTDADHTGAATEVVLPLPAPLAPGAAMALDLFYSGKIAQNAGRLARLGANAAQGKSADWDAIGPQWTALRGFGNVLWYPVASPQLFLSEGNQLFTAIGRSKLRDQQTHVRLRLSVDYVGEPPAAAYFCGRRADLKATPDDPNAPTSIGPGVASAEFTAAPLGFRLPSLFVLEKAETLLMDDNPAVPAPTTQESYSSSAPQPDQPVSTPPPAQQEPTSNNSVIALVSTDAGTAAGLTSAADRVIPLLADWLGARPLSALTVLDHNGQPFQDGPLLVAPAATLQTSTEAPAMVYSLTHAWVQTGQPWMDEGLAQFFALLWVEREQGRDAAVVQLNDILQPVAAVEPDFSAKSQIASGQPLISASDELFYRRKAAAIWWMLRDLAGDKPLRAALTAWRTQPESQESPAAQALAFEHLLERQSGKDFGWFFQDWVLRDRGLPDLTIADVQTSPIPAGAGHNAGWLVAVTVRNEGAAAADVPLTVRSGQFSTTQRIRIPGLTQTTQRILVESTPTEIRVNDGTTPEVRVSSHSRQINVSPQ